jgi:hypothetical protein
VRNALNPAVVRGGGSSRREIKKIRVFCSKLPTTLGAMELQEAYLHIAAKT